MALPNRREFYRAQIPIHASWRVLLPEEVKLVRQGLGKNLFRKGVVATPIDEILERAEPGSPDEQLYRCLQLINNKLDFLIEQSFTKSPQTAPSRGEVVDISGSGLKFICRDHISLGSLLKVDLIMPATAQYQLEMISEAVRVVTQTGGSVVACRIMEIEEAARESIINVVFQKQRQEIRNSKTTWEDPDAH